MKLPDSLFKQKIDKNFADFKNEVLGLDKESIFNMADKISEMTTLHYQTINVFGIDDKDKEYLMQFEKPLEVIANHLKTHEIDDEYFETFGYGLWDIANHKSGEGFSLHTDEEKESDKTEKTSILGQVKENQELLKSQDDGSKSTKKDKIELLE